MHDTSSIAIQSKPNNHAYLRRSAITLILHSSQLCTLRICAVESKRARWLVLLQSQPSGATPMQATKRHETCFLACHCGMLHGAQDHAAAQGHLLVGTDPMPNAGPAIVFHITMAGSGSVLDNVRCNPPLRRPQSRISDAAGMRTGRGRLNTFERVRFWRALALKFSSALYHHAKVDRLDAFTSPHRVILERKIATPDSCYHYTTAQITRASLVALLVDLHSSFKDVLHRSEMANHEESSSAKYIDLGNICPSASNFKLGLAFGIETSRS